MNHLLLCGNDRVKQGLAFVILSYCKYDSEPVTVHFLTGDLRKYDEKFVPLSEKQASFFDGLLKQKNPESSFALHDLTASLQDDPLIEKFQKSRYTPYTLFRLFADRLDLSGRFLYLDTDTCFISDPESLFHTNVDDYEFAGCRDQIGEFWIGRDYMNAGVLLFNAEKCKEANLFPNCREHLLHHHYIMPDQSTLNHLGKKKLILDQKYNEQKRDDQEDTVIRHFSGIIRYFPPKVIKTRLWDEESVKKNLKTHRYDELIEEYRSIEVSLNTL